MGRHRRGFLAALGATATAPVLAGPAVDRGASRGRKEAGGPIKPRLGSAHVDPRYTFTERNVLNEGAERLRDLGTEVIKVWFHRCAEMYSQSSTWPEFDSLVERADHQYFRELFGRPFQTFVLVVYSEPSGNWTNHYFRDGVSDAEYRDEVAQFYEFTKYLLDTYRGTGKEFVLQHWQGDWAIIGSYDRSEEPTDTAIEGMIRWLNARQEGVARAREEVASDVTVLHAPEVNIVLPAMEDGERRVTNAVLPETEVDLVSHNSYAEMQRGLIPPNPNSDAGGTVPPPEQVALMKDTLNYVNDEAPDPSEYVRERLVHPDRNVFVGEYGVPEVTKGVKSQTHQSRVMTDVALDWGARWVIYWQLYDNKEDGSWLVREDGSTTPTYEYFRRLLGTNRVPSVPSYVRVDIEFDRLVDDRAFKCSTFELLDRASGTPLTFDVGTPLEEPLFWEGAFWTHETEDRTFRWFGGNDRRTTIYVHSDRFDGAEALRLHGHPREPGVSAEISVNGARTDEIEFVEKRWRDWHLSLSGAATSATRTPSPTATTTPSPTPATRSPSPTATPSSVATATTSPTMTSNPPTTTVSSPTSGTQNGPEPTDGAETHSETTSPPATGVPGFGTVAGIAAIAAGAYRSVRRGRSDGDG